MTAPTFATIALGAACDHHQARTMTIAASPPKE
jgi:hypothetical protein